MIYIWNYYPGFILNNDTTELTFGTLEFPLNNIP